MYTRRLKTCLPRIQQYGSMTAVFLGGSFFIVGFSFLLVNQRQIVHTLSDMHATQGDGGSSSLSFSTQSVTGSINTGSVAPPVCGSTELYSQGNGGGVDENTPGICGTDNVVSSFGYDAGSAMFKRVCENTNGEQVVCSAEELRCGDSIANGNEECDETDMGSCSSNQLCTSGCACEDTSSGSTGTTSSGGNVGTTMGSMGPLSVSCGGVDDIYSQGNGGGIDETYPGLCDASLSVIDFNYSTSLLKFVWKCKDTSTGEESIQCLADELRCGDDAINGTEFCDGADATCGANEQCNASSDACEVLPPQTACGEDEIYSSGNGSGVNEGYPGLCISGYEPSGMTYNDLLTSFSWTCKSQSGLTEFCTGEELWCGDTIANGNELCDGSDLGTCGNKQTCTTMCACEDVPPTCGLTEIYTDGKGGGIDESFAGLCLDGSKVDGFLYNDAAHTWTWTCIYDDAPGNTAACSANELRCGDNNANGGEVCDGSDFGTCSSGEICASSCICEPEPPPGTCGIEDATSVYTFTKNEQAVDAGSVGLCIEDQTVLDFGFDEEVDKWVWMCEGYKNNSDECQIQAEYCGDGEVNGEEQCDGDATVCGEATECTNLCVCLQHTIAGACGERYAARLYDNSDDASGLSSVDINLCDYGRIEDFTYDEAQNLWTWTCLGVGGAENSQCFAEREWCGDGITNADEQCDDKNVANGDGCSSSCMAESLGALAPAKKEGCGNAITDPEEQCDDGNLVNNDGCDNKCHIEDGWRCTMDSPAICGTLECFQHGEWYSQYNIYGTCCGGLTSLPFQHVPEKLVTPGVQLTLCYDDEIDTPYCLPFANTPGRYVEVPDVPEKKSLVMKDSCVDVYKDYYKLVYDLTNQQHSYCQYTDELYDRVDFADIKGNRKQSAIEALVEHCIVKGPGDRYLRYWPDKVVNRAEFAKILIKVMYIGQEYDVQQEKTRYNGDTYFSDVSKDFRGAQYIAKAYELGVLDPIVSSLEDGFQPYKSMTTQEVIDVMQRIDVGQAIAPDTIEELFSGRERPTRGDIAMLVVTKWRSVFRDYLLLQGKNEAFLVDLLKQLKGQHYSEQYRIIVEEIYSLDAKNEHFSAETNPSDYLLGEYLRGIAR